MSSEPTPHDPWLDLADRVSTGEAIDFAALEAEINDPSARDLLRAFSTLSSIGQLHSRHHLEATRDAPTSPAAADPVDPVDPVEWNPKSGPTWGGLTLVESLGRGASGEVHRAHDPRLQRDVALKLLHPHRVADRQWADAMLREGRALARVDHPNVVRVHGAEKHDGQWGLWMELVEGTDLDRLVQQQVVCRRRRPPWWASA